jgi:D-tyrosyl-tRNA(Tyr) deacylase
VGAEVIGEMGAGLLALVGVGRADTRESAVELARRIVGLRIFNDDNDRMNRSLLEIGGTLGVVSQFTLLGDARHGRRPSYVEACPAEQAAPLIEAVVEAAQELGASVVTGRFQAEMEVSLVNSGPVTILLDTERVF